MARSTPLLTPQPPPPTQSPHPTSQSARRSFDEQLDALISTRMRDALEAGCPMTASASEMGAIAVSRAIVKSDRKLADEVLQAVRETLGAAHKAERSRHE